MNREQLSTSKGYEMAEGAISIQARRRLLIQEADKKIELSESGTIGVSIEAPIHK